MTKEMMQQMMAEIEIKSAKDKYSVDEEDQLSMLVAMDGAMLTVNGIHQLELKDGFLVARCARSEATLLELDRVMGFKLKRAAPKSTGFTAG